jgi:hypothetical protein
MINQQMTLITVYLSLVPDDVIIERLRKLREYGIRWYSFRVESVSEGGFSYAVSIDVRDRICILSCLPDVTIKKDVALAYDLSH